MHKWLTFTANTSRGAGRKNGKCTRVPGGGGIFFEKGALKMWRDWNWENPPTPSIPDGSFDYMYLLPKLNDNSSNIKL